MPAEAPKTPQTNIAGLHHKIYIQGLVKIEHVKIYYLHSIKTLVSNTYLLAYTMDFHVLICKTVVKSI